MSMFRPSFFLRRVLLADAAVSGATGLAMVIGAGLADERLGLPAALLRSAGVVLLPYAAIVGYLAARESLPRSAVWAVIACNVVWAAESILILTTGWIAPTALGQAFIVAQALVVATFAELQYLGLRRSPALA